MKKMSRNFLKALVNLIIISIVVVGVSYYFIFKSSLIGPVFLGLGVLNLLFMKTLKIKIRYVYPDLAFGFVDNILLISAAMVGGSLGGVAGAIIGGVAGNTVADGISAIFEGYVSEKEESLKFKTERKMISSSLGKITGCMFGAGIVLTITWMISVL